ncbi:MAG: hypothetical protein LW629_05440 [Burkholderiales bacterium]|nr:hypothetical protein [Burkholderiales bacterium]
MANRNASSIVAKGKPGSIIAGLLWHPVTSGDPIDQERSVYAFSQSYEAEQLVVAGNDVCLQIGFPQGKNFQKDSRRSGSLYSIACLARVLFKNRDGFLVWVLDNPSENEEVAVSLIEQDLIVLDLLLSFQDAKNLVDSYLADQSKIGVFGLVSNNVNFFPNAEIIDDVYLFGRIEQRCLLRKPRKPRNALGVKRTKKDALKFLAFLVVLAAVVFGMNHFYQKKKTEMLNRIKKTETAKYFDEVKSRLPRIGLGYEAIKSLQGTLSQYPLVFDGWQLDQVKCDVKGCSSFWSGQTAWDKKQLEVFGKKSDVKESKSKKSAAKGAFAESVVYLKTHEIALAGVSSSNEFISAESVLDFCSRERLLLGFGSIKWSCDTKGEPWPVKPKAKIEDGMLTEHKISVQGSVSLIQYVIKRYEGQVFWKELSVMRTDEKISKNESDFMQFQLTGAIYVKN